MLAATSIFFVEMIDFKFVELIKNLTLSSTNVIFD
jgi:hypothetical protein